MPLLIGPKKISWYLSIYPEVAVAVVRFPNGNITENYFITERVVFGSCLVEITDANKEIVD